MAASVQPPRLVAPLRLVWLCAAIAVARPRVFATANAVASECPVDPAVAQSDVDGCGGHVDSTDEASQLQLAAAGSRLQPSPHGAAAVPRQQQTQKHGLGSRNRFRNGSNVNVVALAACLRENVGVVYMRDDSGYDGAKQCANQRYNIEPKPLAVVRVANDVEVQAAVHCAATLGTQACAKNGAHGYDNKAGCDDGVQIDAQDLQDFSVDMNTKSTTFGTGHTLGQLYYKLAQDPYGLLIPGGTVSGVGASGLILGGGRGLMTFQRGLACDSLLAIEYVDAQGELQRADSETNSDMLWMARGGGGQFPGIVTKFTMQAYDMPSHVTEQVCKFPGNSARAVMQAWLEHAEEMEEPERKVYTSVQWWSSPSHILVEIACNGCTESEQQWADSRMEAIIKRGGTRDCNSHTNSWIDQILSMSGVDSPGVVTPPNEQGLLDRSNGWGKKPDLSASQVTGRMGYDWHLSDELFDQLEHWINTDGVEEPYVLLVMFSPTGGPKVESISEVDTAYGHRDAKWNVQLRYSWNPDKGNAFSDAMLQHSLGFQRAIDPYLPCANFYNYVDDYMTCAETNDEWLEAYFSDVSRMKSIKMSADPNEVFQSRILRGPPVTTTGMAMTTATDTPPDTTCSEREEDCRQTKCCERPGDQCYEKNEYWAQCAESCEPGLHADDPPEWQSPWSCAVLSADR